MRFKLHLKPLHNQQRLPFNYQYPIQAWLYKLLYQADQSYAHFLHNHGYSLPDSSKHFKHFTFSSIQLKTLQPIRRGDTSMLLGLDPCSLLVSFYIDQAAEHFIMGLFQEQQLSIYTKEAKAHFAITQVETLASPFDHYQNHEIVSLSFRTISPMVIAYKQERSNDQYLSPADDSFARYFAINLLDRYRTIAGEGISMDAHTAEKLIKFTLLSDPTKIKKRGFTVKEGNAQAQTKVIGYSHFSFELTAPVSLLKVGYFGGFGKEASMGCGCVELLDEPFTKF